MVFKKGTIIEKGVRFYSPSDHTEDNVSRHVTIGKNCLIRSGCIIYPTVQIGDDVRFGHDVLVRSNTRIGHRTLIGTKTIIEGDVEIGDDCSIQSGVYIPRNTLIEEHVFLGPNVTLTNDKSMEQRQDADLKGPKIRRYASIGANVTILPDIEIGMQATVGAGAVVTKNVKPHTCVVGNPAREIPQKKR